MVCRCDPLYGIGRHQLQLKVYDACIGDVIWVLLARQDVYFFRVSGPIC